MAARNVDYGSGVTALGDCDRLNSTFLSRSKELLAQLPLALAGVEIDEVDSELAGGEAFRSPLLIELRVALAESFDAGDVGGLKTFGGEFFLRGGGENRFAGLFEIGGVAVGDFVQRFHDGGGLGGGFLVADTDHHAILRAAFGRALARIGRQTRLQQFVRAPITVLLPSPAVRRAGQPLTFFSTGSSRVSGAQAASSCSQRDVIWL